MDGFIRVAALTLGAFFSGATTLRLPWFQRAYAWRTEHAGRLVADILGAKEGEKGRYALGQIRLAGPVTSAEAALVDGHQRTITLTILFAVLRDWLAATHPGEAEALNQLIFLERDRQPASVRLQPQQNIAEFFFRYVQAPGSTGVEPGGDHAELSQVARNILDNRAMIVEAVKDMDAAAQVALARFLRQSCWIVVLTVEDENEAWTMLTNEEETGLDFHASERSKITIISVMPQSEQAEARRIWEQAQADLGSDGIHRLLGHIRTLTMRRRSRHPVERDLIERHKLDRNGKAFMNGPFASCVARAIAISQRSIGIGETRAAIARRLDMLSWLDERFWMPPLLRWLEVRGAEHEDTLAFIERLDRLAWCAKIAGDDPIENERRMIRVMQDVDTGRRPEQLASLAIDKKHATKIGNRLRERTFYLKGCCGLVLRRLSLVAGHLHGPIDGVHVTIEHILPRNPPAARFWHRNFKGDAIVEHTNRLGNLVFLSREANSAAGNEDYAAKRGIYAESGFAMAATVARETETWTPQAIMARAEALIAALCADMHLPPV